MSPSFPFCYSWDVSYPSDLPRGGWFNLVRVCVVYDCKPMMAVFFFFWWGGGEGGLLLLLFFCWAWDVKRLVQFQASEMSPGLFQDFINGYIKP